MVAAQKIMYNVVAATVYGKNLFLDMWSHDCSISMYYRQCMKVDCMMKPALFMCKHIITCIQVMLL